MDDGCMRNRGSEGSICGIAQGRFPDPVSITLPKGETPSFALALEELGDGLARAGIVKDAGDDPDVTHGAMVVVTVRMGGPGIRFFAGEGVGIGDPGGIADPAGGACHQSRAAPDD